jgi:zinc ribbon protein
MAFCNSCGTALAAGAQFCPKCGAATGAPATPLAVSSTAAAPLPGAPAPAQGGGALKIILIIVAIVIGLIIIAGGSCAYFVHRAITRTHVNQKNGEVSIDTPFGSLNSTTDPSQAAKDTGVEAYPGATVEKNGAANMNIGKMHTATVTYESDDPPAAVADFYKSKFPGANMTSGENGRYSLLSGGKDDLTTITIEPRDGKTKIMVARVTNTGMSH